MKKARILIFLLSSLFLLLLSSASALAQYIDCVTPDVCRSETTCPGTIDKSWLCNEDKYCCRLPEAPEKSDITNPALKGFGTGEGATIIAQIIANALKIIFAVSGLVLLAMLLIGGFQWMTAGGNKETLATAQKRISSALIGFVIFISVFAIVNYLLPALGIDLKLLEIEWPIP